MGQIPITIGKCRLCGIGVVVRYIGKDGVLCPEHKKMVTERKMLLKKPKTRLQHTFIPTNKKIVIIKDALPVAEGGFFPGQKFFGEDAEQMFHNCSFAEGTLIRIDGRRYTVLTVETKDGNKRQVPIPYRK